MKITDDMKIGDYAEKAKKEYRKYVTEIKGSKTPNKKKKEPKAKPIIIEEEEKIIIESIIAEEEIIEED